MDTARIPRIPRFPEAAARGSVEIRTNPETAYGTVSDPLVMAGLAEETYRARWLGGVATSVPGARFRGYNRHGVRRWVTTCRITDVEPGRRFAYEVTASPLRIPISRWQYDIEPAADGGCTVTETNWLRVPLWFIPAAVLITGVLNRPGVNRSHINTTLQRLKSRLEGASARPEPTEAN
ncbi:SRPBCC family protein [Streptomyces monticola]|uniref:SRPBCC family protein n=1 Tax=Streptomyces monticola TaxID=2666263 RepID=A0ABW2JCU1_9ACTN